MSDKQEKVLRILNQKLKYFRYSETYSCYCKKFLYTVNKYSQHLTAKDFQDYLDTFNFTSTSQQNQIINAIKFFYEKVLNRKYGKIDFTRPRKEKKLPRVIDNVYLLDCINKIENLKHKTIISLAYSVGLRVSEVINLQIKDLDSKRKIITIRQSKGNKDRIVPLTDTMLYLIADYWRKFKPTDYLFNGLNSLRYSATSCNKIVKKYLGENYHFHLLRHSCFTNLTDQGVDLRVIQKLAGHSSSKTTEIYTHVSNRVLHNLPLGI